ncbi:MAG: DUF1028 domain-containing protein [Planctomycetota bacterium]
MRTLQRIAAGALATCLAAAPALATWSVVVVNLKTREVGVGCATCIVNIDLQPRLPMVRPGLGVGNVSAWWDTDGSRRQTMWDAFGNGHTPKEILEQLRLIGGHQKFQFGIVGFHGVPVTYTSPTAGAAVCGVSGIVGDLAYAIQGNVMTGEAVCLEAERMLLTTDGDLSTKLMAAMQGARSMGGDGRCSCSQANPPGCGSPPPNFTKSAHTAFMILSRVGDPEGTCGVAKGCANGKYYFGRTVVGDVNDTDPILVLQGIFDNWRQKQKGRPDHLLSLVQVDRQQLVADGLSSALVTVELIDIDGTPLGHGGDTLILTQTSPDPPIALPGPVTDNGDGTYTFELAATQSAGRGMWNIVVDFGKVAPRLLYPPLVLNSVPLTDFHAGVYEQSVERGGAVPFTINRGASEAGRAYHVLGTLSGTSPGVTIGGVWVPLNRDRLLEHTWLRPGPPTLPGSAGVLDGNGWAQAWLDLPPTSWSVLVGQRMDFCALLWGPNPEVTVVDGFPIVP